jgi:hypothetical protein
LLTALGFQRLAVSHLKLKIVKLKIVKLKVVKLKIASNLRLKIQKATAPR